MQTPSEVVINKKELPLAPGKKIRVLVVDDSLVIRRFLTRVLAAESAFEVVGYAASGALALLQEAQLHPDVITMDIEMPEMDGLAAVSALRARGSKAVIIMCSTLTKHGGQSTIEALLRGANDYVTKPEGKDSIENSFEAMSFALIPTIKQFFLQSELPKISLATSPVLLPRPPYMPQPMVGIKADAEYPSSVIRLEETATKHCDIVAIGVSTGGPTALLKLLPRLPIDFPLPIVIVQHMPPIFTRQLAERLNTECAIEVLEAQHGTALEAGRALLAPGGRHMRLKKVLHTVQVILDDGEPENSCRPAVDVLFRSVSAIYGSRALAVILTGMGRDGLTGAQSLKRGGGYVIAQDRESSVVWGMPGAVVEAGLADAVVSLDDVASTILRRVRKV